MKIMEITKKNNASIKYVGKLCGIPVTVLFINGAIPIEGNINIFDGTLISKNDKNYYYVKDYKEA